MRAIKGLIFFGISMVMVSSCFDPPEFSVIPEIEYEDIYFGQSATRTDSLVLVINFKDGDGDLGLRSDDVDDPYHDINYYLANNGDLNPIGKSQLYTNLPQFLNPPSAPAGKLARLRTRNDPQYNSVLPGYNDPYSCTFYRYDSVFISEPDKHIFDDTYTIKRILSNSTQPNVYVLVDTFYYQRNPNHTNIDIEFLIKESNGTFTEYDWEKEFCVISFNQRFPVLTDRTNTLEGKLIYSMRSDGFEPIFSVRTLKLRVTVKDRALNRSNTIETPEFTLQQIRR